MKVRCEYCDSYMEDTEERCPHCGAVNENHQRTSSQTPQTIGELKGWYKARNLPPEEVTRFFIGKDVREPKAFGIYEEYGQFIVYKNKADGSRAIRYKGTDEAYAVNELYLRLKEEILHQKSININRSSEKLVKKGKNRRKFYLLMIFMIIFPSFVSALIPIMFNVTSSKVSNSAVSGTYYYTDSKELFYCSNSYESDWWQYDFTQNSWEQYTGTLSERVPLALNGKLKDAKEFLFNLVDMVNTDYNRAYEYDELNISCFRNYIDAGHHSSPAQHYYEYNNEFYYYLDDIYGDSYGSGDNSGWYKYDPYDNSWDYYCDQDNKTLLGDELYYNDEDYLVYDFETTARDAYDYLPGETWNVSTFETTNWYLESVAAENAYDQYMDSYESSSYDSWDYDSSYDWDSGSSWDSGSTDWDSDW